MPPGKAEVGISTETFASCSSSQRVRGPCASTIGKSSCLPVMLSTSRPGRRISFATTRANRSAVLKPGYAMNRKGLAQRYAAGAS
jgi:hypothetical protein